jgi:hypothetical protein
MRQHNSRINRLPASVHAQLACSTSNESSEPLRILTTGRSGLKKYSFSVRRRFAIVRILESDDFYPSGGDFSPQYSSSYHLETVSHVVIIRYRHGQWGTSEHEIYLVRIIMNSSSS